MFDEQAFNQQQLAFNVCRLAAAQRHDLAILSKCRYVIQNIVLHQIISMALEGTSRRVYSPFS